MRNKYFEHRRAGKAPGFTLLEVVISMAIVTISLVGILQLYMQSAYNSDWSSQSMAAQMMAVSGLEQCRAAKFDPRGSPPTDQLVSSNFPVRVDILDTSSMSSAVSYGTNTTTILTISTNPMIKMIKVDCTWAFPRHGVFTNSVYTYRAPNQ